MSERRDPWRHVIVVACAGVMFFCPSTVFSHGVLLSALTETGRYNINTLAWLLSFTDLMRAVGGPLASVLINFTSCRTAVIVAGLAGLLGPSLASCTSDIRLIFVSYGILMGLARGIAMSTTTVCIGYWFKEDSSLASGLMFTGVGVGMLVHPRLLRLFVDTYAADGALLMMGAVAFHTCACGLLLRPATAEIKKKHSRKEEKTKQIGTKESIRNFFRHFKSNILTNYSFMFLVLGVSLFMMGFQIITTFMPDFFQFHGSTPQESALMASVMGSGSLVSRILVGILTNDPNIGTMLLFQGNCGLSAIFTFLLPVLAEFVVGRYVYAVVIGMYLTCLFVIFGPATLEKVGIEDLAYGLGFMYLNTAVVCLIGPPLAVQARVLTGSYNAVFILAGTCLIGSCLCGLLSELFKRSDIENHNIHPAEGTLLVTTVPKDDDDSCQESISTVTFHRNDSVSVKPFLESDI